MATSAQELFAATMAVNDKLVEEVQFKMSALRKQMLEEPNNWAIVGDMQHINSCLNNLLGKEL